MILADTLIWIAMFRTGAYKAELPISFRDPKDDKFLALTAECEASILVSSDEDLLVLHPWNEVRIERPAEFLLEGE